MSNAARHRKKAAEFEQLKQVDRAIASYIKAIEEGEVDGEDIDVALFNKVGDLTLRQGRVADAVTYYERAVEHYATAGLFNNAIALCNKILRSAPGRANVYFSLGRICAKKGLRGDATRNFLEYATRMQQDGRVDEGMRALAEVADLMPELVEVRRLVEEHAARAGITLPQRKTPVVNTAVVKADGPPGYVSDKSSELVFLDLGEALPANRRTPQVNASVSNVATPKQSPVTVINDLPYIEVPRTPITAQPAIQDPDTRVAPVVAPVAASVVASATAVEPAADVVAEVVGERPVKSTPSWVPIAESDVVGAVTRRAPEDVVEDVPEVGSIEGLEVREFDAEAALVPSVDGLNTDEVTAGDVRPADDFVPNLTWLVPANADLNATEPDGLLLTDEGGDQHELTLDSISGLEVEDVDGIADAVTPLGTVGARAGQPPVGAAEARFFTPLASSPIPELDAALAAGAMAIARAIDSVDEALPRPPFRLDPHDFILPGELPPLMVDDALIERGLEQALRASARPQWNAPADTHFEIDTEHDDDIDDVIADASSDPAHVQRTDAVQGFDDIDDGDAFDMSELDALGEEAPANTVHATPRHDDVTTIAFVEIEIETRASTDDADVSARTTDASDVDASDVDASDVDASDVDASDVAEIDGDETVADVAMPTASAYAVRSTPSLPTAAVAIEANALAAARRDELKAAVAATPHDWARRRRLAESMFEAGEREAGLAELQAALSGFAQNGALDKAADIADQLVGIAPERIAYHQKRVELAVRLNDQGRLSLAYLDLADTLIRTGDDVRAHAVFARVLEIDPYDVRARAALGAAAPPPPPPPRADDDYEDLAQWLKDDAPISTRMRMQEPAVTGDEQADFDALLRHFKDGVARSVGEDDYESRYDLGVAYKEMGLLDDAITEFQKALRSARHRLPAYEALGQCFVEQERHSVAVTVLTRALHEPGLDDQLLIGVLYLLAYSCEALQRWEEARSYYSRVYATDTSFRDAAARLAGLDQIAQ